ncbi:glycosyltransferase 87 family protein [Thalassotalea montiporae]
MTRTIATNTITSDTLTKLACSGLHATTVHSRRSWLLYASLVGAVLVASMSHWLSEVHSQLSQAAITSTTIELGGDGWSLANSDLVQWGMGNLVIVQFTLMCLCMLVAWYSVRAYQQKTQQNTSFAASMTRASWLILAAGILARIVLLGVEPYTSNDVDRYLFDGRIALTGLDPYQVSHDDPALVELRTIWQPPAEHAAYPTLYPPLALALFSLAASVGIDHAQSLWQLMLTCASIASLWLMFLLLKAHNKLVHLPLIALSPIVIIETGAALHVDAFSTLAIVAALYCWQRNKLVLTGICVGLGVLTKILPLVLLMPLVFANFSLRRAITLVASAIATISLGYAITLALGLYPVGSIGVFFEKWRFAAPLFSLLTPLGTQAFIAALAGVTLSLIAIVGYLASRQQANAQKPVANNEQTLLSNDLVSACQLALFIPLFISPVLFPWYLMPLAALVALKPNLALLLILGVMPFTYEVLDQFVCCQIWQPAQWPINLLAGAYLFALLSLIYAGVTRWKKQTITEGELSSPQKRFSC